MGLDAKAGFSGLVTATGEVSSEPGALRIADNVTLRREGALSLRQLFSSSALARAYKAAFAYRGALYYIAGSNVIYDSAEATMTYLGVSPPAVRDDVQSAKEARGNLYFATASGAFKVTGIGAALGRSGLPAGEATVYLPGQIATGSPLILANNQQVAYRVVAKRTDPNGVVIRSRPTGAVLISNTSGANSTPSITLAIRTGSQVDEVELYRTRVFPTTAQVDDELQLVATLPASLFTGNPALYTFVDRVLDTARGTTLYTSPSRGGAEQAYDRPPGAACIERFRGSVFFGNIVGPQRATFSYKYSGTAPITGSATGIGARAATGNTTNGSGSITSVSNTTGLQVGMLVQGTGVNGYVTAIAGSTVTVSPVATATNAGVALSFRDTIRYTYGGSTYGAAPAYAASLAATSYSMSFNGIHTAYEVTPPQPGYDVTVVFEAIDRGNQNVTIAATHGDEYSPPLPLASGTWQTMSFESIPNGLAWSEPDEPEHVPPKNFARVGDAGRAILALVATRDRLLIFKEDGLFMLVGDTIANFGIYPLDTTCLCILPGSVRRLQNTVYALTNLGLVAVDENGGVTVVSRPIQTELAPIVTQIRQAQKASGLYLMPGLTGITGTSDDPNGEYWLALGSTTPSFGGQVLVWSAFRGGFTTYSFTSAPVALSADGEGQPLVLSANSLQTPSTSLGAITARVSPHALSDPALLNKLWTHIVVGFSRLTGTTSVTATFTSSESMLEAASVTETVEAPTTGGLIQAPRGTLLRHLAPNAVKRAYLAFVELTIAVASGTFVLELIGTESRENIPNKRPTHGTGAT